MKSLAASSVAALALALGGPARASAGAAPGWIDGIALRGPITPVCRVGVPCDGPAAGVLVVVTRRGRVFARAVSGRGGRFAVRVAPGVYVVRASWRGGIVRRPQVRVVHVLSGRVARVRFLFDTGIR